jgi:tRNA (guanine37-N1)-methyltransferase
MRIVILTIFPRMFDSFLAESMLARAIANGLLAVEAVDLRPFSSQKHKNTDDAPFGGGAGMVMVAPPNVKAMSAIAPAPYAGRRIYLSPRGGLLTQQKAQALSRERELILLCGHYEGVDQRAIDLCIDEELSVGDYVLTGGELPALVLCDCITRLLPGVLAADAAFANESHYGGLLEYPQYTRPAVWEGRGVPEVLLGGNHALQEQWRKEQMMERTRRKRPDILNE